MIVGKPPFTADTSTAVAVKHVQERPLAPSLLGVSIAQSLEAIILKLLAKNPANRYPKAEDLRADLKRYLDGAHRIPARPRSSPPTGTTERPVIAPRAPAPGPTTTGSGRPVAARRPTGSQPSVRPPGAPAVPRSPAAPGAPAVPSVPGSPGSPGGPGGPVAQMPAAPPPGGEPPHQYGPPAYYYEEVHRSDGWKRTVLMFLGLVGLVVALGFLALTFYRSLGLDDEDGTPTPTTVSEAVLIEVPDLIGLSYGDADARLRSLGLESDPSYQIKHRSAREHRLRPEPARRPADRGGRHGGVERQPGRNPESPAGAGPQPGGRCRDPQERGLRGHRDREPEPGRGRHRGPPGAVVEHGAGPRRGGDHHRVHRAGPDIRARHPRPDA